MYHHSDVPVIHRGNLYVVFKNSIDPVDGVRKWHFNKALWVYYNKSKGMRVPKALQKAGAYKTLLCEDYVLVSESVSKDEDERELACSKGLRRQ